MVAAIGWLGPCDSPSDQSRDLWRSMKILELLVECRRQSPKSAQSYVAAQNFRPQPQILWRIKISVVQNFLFEATAANSFLMLQYVFGLKCLAVKTTPAWFVKNEYLRTKIDVIVQFTTLRPCDWERHENDVISERWSPNFGEIVKIDSCICTQLYIGHDAPCGPVWHQLSLLGRTYCKCSFESRKLVNNHQVEAQLDYGLGSEIGVGWKIRVTWSRKHGVKMAATELGYSLTKSSFLLSLWHDISISWHGGKEWHKPQIYFPWRRQHESIPNTHVSAYCIL